MRTKRARSKRALIIFFGTGVYNEAEYVNRVTADQSASRVNVAALAADECDADARNDSEDSEDRNERGEHSLRSVAYASVRSFDGLPFMVIPSDDEGNIGQTSRL